MRVLVYYFSAGVSGHARQAPETARPAAFEVASVSEAHRTPRHDGVGTGMLQNINSPWHAAEPGLSSSAVPRGSADRFDNGQVPGAMTGVGWMVTLLAERFA